MSNPIITDLKASLASWRLWTLLGWLEVRQRYARSRVGPFWLTISMGVMIASIGIVYGTLFGQKMTEYLPFLAISLVMWTFFAQTSDRRQHGVHQQFDVHPAGVDTQADLYPAGHVAEPGHPCA